MRKVFGRICKFAATFVVLTGLFCLAMYWSCSFDSEKMEYNTLFSSRILSGQGSFPVVFNPLNVQNDNYTDAVMVNEMYSVDCHEPWVSCMKIRKNYKLGLTQNEISDTVGDAVSAIYDETNNEELFGDDIFDPLVELQQFLDGKLHTAIVYGRYWHGYFATLRPLLAFFNIVQIRSILLWTYILLLAAFLYLLYRRFGRDITIIFGSSLVCCGYFTASFSLQACSLFLTLMVSLIVLVKRLDKMKDFYLFLFVVACCANFFDYLTVPMLTMGFPIGIYLLKLREEGKSWQHCLRFVVVSVSVWLLGYAATWFSKWVIYDITIKDCKSMVYVGISQCIFRMSRSNPINPMFDGKEVFLDVMINGKAALFAVIIESLLMYLHNFSISIKGFNRHAWPYILLTLIPVTWYIVLANHTMVHYFFTFRLSAVFMLGMLLAMNEIFFGSTQPDSAAALSDPTGTESSSGSTQSSMSSTD